MFFLRILFIRQPLGISNVLVHVGVRNVFPFDSEYLSLIGRVPILSYVLTSWGRTFWGRRVTWRVEEDRGGRWFEDDRRRPSRVPPCPDPSSGDHEDRIGERSRRRDLERLLSEGSTTSRDGPGLLSRDPRMGKEEASTSSTEKKFLRRVLPFFFRHGGCSLPRMCYHLRTSLNTFIDPLYT